jgi:hypothetical protein
VGYSTYDYMDIPKDIPDTLINNFIYLAGSVRIRWVSDQECYGGIPRNHKATVTPGGTCIDVRCKDIFVVRMIVNSVVSKSDHIAGSTYV